MEAQQSSSEVSTPYQMGKLSPKEVFSVTQGYKAYQQQYLPELGMKFYCSKARIEE